MASIKKRKQLVNELRQAHFPFGFQQKNEKSQYAAKYPAYQGVEYQQPNNNGRKNNFSIGNQNDIDSAAYKSEFKDKFPVHNVKGKQEAIGAKNMGANNIVFGYEDQNGYKTNYKDEFEKKVAENNRVKPNDLKKNNIEFGDSLTDFTTTYGKVFDHKNAQINTTNVPINDGRKSNLVLGNDKSSFETQNANTFKNTITTTNPYVHKQSNTSNINLGSDGINYSSECKQRFTVTGKPDRQIVGPDVVRDFRSAHFNFGFPQQKTNFQSEAKDQFNKKPIDLRVVDGRKPSNIQLNVDGNNYFESSYGKQFTNYGTQPLSQTSNNARKDNILIGTDNDPKDRYISQARDNFGSKPINKTQPYILTGTLQLGEEKNDFKTHNQLTYDDKFNKRQNSKLSQDDINRMKAINIVTGFSGNNYNLHSSEYGKKQGQPSHLSKETLAKMKNTNIVLETVPTGMNIDTTSYKVSYPYKINENY